ncbi:MAG TPA: lipopolysaccharide biosynthesis protein [Rhizobiaceae bacterium]|nr:lipopolysaccharide biosynthesis protein [Rhizobiaceae bacterium]
MTEISEAPRAGLMAKILALATARRNEVAGYAKAVSGSAGRLVFSLVYFVALANTLSIGDFGLFATASAAGVMLSRIVAFGFISALYRTATVRPRLIGTFSAGFIALGLLSLPALAVSSWMVFLLFFWSDISPFAFALVIVAEAVLWRPAEVVVIVNNGLGRFGRAALLVIIGTLMRAIAALLFALLPAATLGAWCWLYLGANAASLAVAVLFFHPRQKLRLRMPLYWRRLPDSLYVAGAEVLFYLQMELDKLLVLALGGPRLAGIYAIVMRLVDLTAIPIRTFSMMLVQKIMRRRDMLSRPAARIGIEAGIFSVSTLALVMLALLLHFFPNALGRNVAEAAPLVGLVLLVPGLRNLVEYQGELLFARGQTLIRAGNLALLAVGKAGLLAWLLATVTDIAQLMLWLNAVFAGLYFLSAALTYPAMKLPAKRI